MKFYLSRWAGIPLLLAATGVAGSLYMTWRQSDQESQIHLLVQEQSSSRLQGEISPGASDQGSQQPKSGEVNRTFNSALQTPASLETQSVPYIARGGEGSLSQDRLGNAASISSTKPDSSASTHSPATFTPPPLSLPNGAEGSLEMQRGTASAAPAPVQPRMPVVFANPAAIAFAAPVQAPIPVVFANPAAVAALPQEQQDGVTQIANDFNSTIQAAGAAPSSPQYHRVWRSAVSAADQQFEAMYGIDAFNQLEMSQ